LDNNTLTINQIFILFKASLYIIKELKEESLIITAYKAAHKNPNPEGFFKLHFSDLKLFLISNNLLIDN
jgi:hypothetical protein